MLVELGPVAAGDVQRWTKFARRVIVELRVDPGDLEGVATEDLLKQWSQLIDEWASIASESEEFRWSKALDTEVGEFLLHGLERCFHSPGVRIRITEEEAEAQRPFTMHVLAAFVDALTSEGVGHEHYADQIRASLGRPLD
ncbi:MAG: hypothetical protein OEV40_25310 [Acidimicrobiia bacterium]|nr:hypothetical protein [Acidimicrobiia bacterium]